MLGNDVDLFALLDVGDVARLEVGCERLLAEETGAAAARAHWIELLLAWHITGSRMKRHLAEGLLNLLTEDQLSALDGTLYQQFLPDVANTILGLDAFEKASDIGSPASFAYTPVAHALSFGACKSEWLPPYITCARDACYFMHKLDFCEAIHALCCVSARRRGQTGRACHEHVDTFLQDARSYLDWAAAAIGSSRLRWEIRIWDRIWARTA